MKSKLIIAVLVVFSLAIIWAFSYVIRVSDNHSNSFTIHVNFKHKNFVLSNYLTKTNSGNLKATFPYKSFLDSSSWWNQKTIESAIQSMDSVCGTGAAIPEDILIASLCDSLTKNKSSYQNPDSLNDLLIYAANYLSYSELNTKQRSFFIIVANTWIDFVSTRVSEMVKADNSLKYNFKIRFLSERCAQFTASTNFGASSFEKITLNVIDRQWKYLFVERFWKSTSIFVKIATIAPILLLLTTLIYGCVCIFQKHFK